MLNWRGPNLLISSGIVSPKEWLFTKVEIVVPGGILFLLRGDYSPRWRLLCIWLIIYK